MCIIIRELYRTTVRPRVFTQHDNRRENVVSHINHVLRRLDIHQLSTECPVHNFALRYVVSARRPYNRIEIVNHCNGHMRVSHPRECNHPMMSVYQKVPVRIGNHTHYNRLNGRIISDQMVVESVGVSLVMLFVFENDTDGQIAVINHQLFAYRIRTDNRDCVCVTCRTIRLYARGFAQRC